MIPFNEENKAKIIRVAEDLEGTCDDLDDALQRAFGEGVTLTDFDTELLRSLDSVTLQCEDCGWWCEANDIDDEGICTDCREN